MCRWVQSSFVTFFACAFQSMHTVTAVFTFLLFVDNFFFHYVFLEGETSIMLILLSVIPVFKLVISAFSCKGGWLFNSLLHHGTSYECSSDKAATTGDCERLNANDFW